MTGNGSRILEMTFLVAGLLATAAAAPDPGAYDRFQTEISTAMDKMMAGMQVRRSGDVDRDFAEAMIPHHQGAIDMAEAELRYGRNEQLRRIAQEIIVDQQQEIAAMRLALGDALPPPAPAPTRVTPTDRSAR
jgi:uncharacterized protein (DUF305 family)